HRWQIVSDTDLNGAAHSRTHARLFVHVSTLLPSLFPPEWHTLTSPAIPIDPGPAFLIFSQRYDLTGRTVPVLPVGSNDTDDAYIEVRYNGGPWTPLAHYTHRDLTWRGASFNLTAQISGPTTFQVRFNVSANVIGNSGGWWIDDVMIAERGLAPAVVLLGSTGPYVAAAGGVVGLGVQVVNVGDYETSFRLDVALPESSWGATVRGDTSAPLSGYLVRLAPDNDIAVRIRIAVPSPAPAGLAPPERCTGGGRPTGMGETAVAAMVIAEILRKRGGKILFLAPTKPLVEQHAASLRDLLVVDRIALFTGEVTSPEERELLWRENKVIVSTPQVIRNDLRAERFSLEDVSLIIFDEAHRPVGDYAYVDV